jgi:uncharacterized glyoxalase superfamily protein PhnB
MNRNPLAAAALLTVAACAAALPESEPMKKLTPILVVDGIEECLPFWVDRLGFTKSMEAPDGDRLAFVGLVHGSIEIMLQTRSSVTDDLPALAPEVAAARGFLYLEVEDIDAVAALLDGVEVVMPRRETFYGATEISVREPGGHFVTFAQISPTAQAQ